MPYKRAEIVGYAYSPTLKILKCWLDVAMERTMEGKLSPISEALSNTLPSLIESMQVIIASHDSTVKEKLEAAAIISKVNGRVNDKETSNRITAEKAALLDERRTRLKSIDKRHTVAERKRIDKALAKSVAEFRTKGESIPHA